jgi:hypothetical protein
MPAIAACPRCHEAVTVPDEFRQEELVHCPLCFSEYLLREVVAPELVSVSDAAPSADASDAADLDLVAEEQVSPKGSTDVPSFENLFSETILSSETKTDDTATAGTSFEELSLDEELSVEGQTEELVVADDSEGLTVDETETVGESVSFDSPIKIEPFSIEEFEVALDAPPSDEVKQAVTETELLSLSESESGEEEVAASHVEEAAEDLSIEEWPEPAVAEEAEPAFGETVEETTDAFSLENEGGETEGVHEAVDEEIDGNEAVIAVAKQAPKGAAFRAKKGPGMLQMLAKLVGLVTSALLGCLVGYYAIAWWLGPHFREQNWPVLEFLPYISELTAPAKTSGTPQATTATSKTSGGEAKKSGSEPLVSSTPTIKYLRPQPGSVNYVGPRMRPSFTGEQLGNALKSIEPALAAAGAEAFSARNLESLYGLCQIFTFANGDEKDASLVKRIKDGTDFFRRVAAQPGAFEMLGKLGANRMATKLDANAGVVLAGTVRSSQKEKKSRVWETVVELAGQSTTAVVLSEQECEAKAGEQVFVAGVFTKNPGSTLVGYNGNQPVVVWAALAVKNSVAKK